jgi:ubiquinone/menaquinone biosynthesis C-methylase UbiE
MLKQLHYKLVFIRRIKVLSKELSAFINEDSKLILDIGSGDGTISKLIQDNNSAVHIDGLDVMARPSSLITVKLYDGRNIPYNDNIFDVAMFIDVLHHLAHIKELLLEAKRVSKKYILIKDHIYKSRFDFTTLKFMDDFGNKPYGVARVYNYLKEEEWQAIFSDVGLVVVKSKIKIPLYSFPFNLIFGRKLHFISLLQIIEKQ